MGRSVKELRERADAGELSQDDIKFLKDREGIGTFDAILATLEDAEFDELDEDGDEGPYSDLGVDDLRDELKARDLPVSGNKAELIARLEADDEEDE